MQTYFLGEPPANIKTWIIDNYAPAYHADTWYKYANDTEWRTVSITGELTDSSIPNVIDVTTLEIGSAVTSIGDGSFADCSGLTSVTIPDSVTRIERDAFSGCRGLTGVTIGDCVTSIGGHAFSGCSGLMGVTIPDSVTIIRREAFEECTSLTSVTIVANGGNAEEVKEMMISAGVDDDIEWIIY